MNTYDILILENKLEEIIVYLVNLIIKLIKIVTIILTISILPNGILILILFLLYFRSPVILPNHENNWGKASKRRPKEKKIKPKKIKNLAIIISHQV